MSVSAASFAGPAFWRMSSVFVSPVGALHAALSPRPCLSVPRLSLSALAIDGWKLEALQMAFFLYSRLRYTFSVTV